MAASWTKSDCRRVALSGCGGRVLQVGRETQSKVSKLPPPTAAQLHHRRRLLVRASPDNQLAHCSSQLSRLSTFSHLVVLLFNESTQQFAPLSISLNIHTYRHHSLFPTNSRNHVHCSFRIWSVCLLIFSVRPVNMMLQIAVSSALRSPATLPHIRLIPL